MVPARRGPERGVERSELAARGLALGQQRLGFHERGVVAHRAEQLRRLPERLLGGGVRESDQATALAEEGVGVLWDAFPNSCQRSAASA
jgi:hypothetical protein